MVWVRIVPNLIKNAKFKRASHAARLLYLEALCYANFFETDGLITSMDLGMLQYMLGDQKIDPKPIVEELLTLRLWELDCPEDGEVVQGAWWIHDYAEFQPTRDAQARARELARQRNAQNESSSGWHFPDRTKPQSRNDKVIKALDVEYLRQARKFTA